MFDRLYFVGIFLLSLSLGWLLSLAYPEGLTNPETQGYWLIAKDFKWFEPNPLDWVRTIPFGAVLTFCSQFEHPSRAVYWINTTLFSLNVALVFLLGRSLFSSALAGLMLALGSLLFEFASMRIFFSNLLATADPFFAQLVYLATLLSLIGWLYSRRVVFCCAYAIFGIAIFTKPVGVTLLPIWFLFAFGAWWTKTQTNQSRWLTILVSLLLIIAPSGFWCLRNYIVYGRPKTTAMGGCAFYNAVLPIVSDQEKVFDDPDLNTRFIGAIRRCEKKFEMQPRANVPAYLRQIWYEEYFYNKEDLSPPFEFLTTLTIPPWNKRDHEKYYFCDSDEMFRVDSLAGQIALKIILAHPMEYWNRVEREYVSLFTPMLLSPEPCEVFASDPEDVYRKQRIYPVGVDFDLYPHSGKPELSLSNAHVAKMIGSFIGSMTVISLFSLYYSIQLWLTHFLFIAALFTFVVLRFWSSRSLFQRRVERIALVMIILFLTAALNYLAIALCHIAEVRYAISGGELELHLMTLIALIACIWALLSNRIATRSTTASDAGTKGAVDS